MGYKNYLLRLLATENDTVGWDFPHRYIKADTYQAYVNMQDVDPWTDANGYLHRNAVDLKAFKVEFETIPMLSNTEFRSIIQNIENYYQSQKERTVIVSAYIPEYDDYVIQRAYLADFTPQIYGIFDGIIKYNPIRLAFIGGLANG